MVRREDASAEVSVCALEKGATASLAGGPETWIVYVLRGAAQVEIDCERRAILAHESLLTSGAVPLAITAADEGATMVLVTIGPPARFPALA